MKIGNSSLLVGFLKAVIPLFFYAISFGQTLIMNEVSNGPSGNKEYVEFVVTDTAVTFDCGASTPPCIDIRGWIFDDNSGYHGTGGIAAGAVRFSFDPLWSCVPLGTIILIYNDADVNPDIPAIDISTTDGNCSIIAPISNAALFETNLTTPGAVACSYPASGWTPGGLWSSTLMANTGDCARIVDLAGCEVFSVCWATCSTSTLIYFNSSGSGTDNVWYFNDGDPNLQANWSEGCADATSCGVDEQTPGTANNALNAAFISQFNNGCTPITPISSSIGAIGNATCSCTGYASVVASGSIAVYSYAWYDSAFTPIGQTNDTATNLCAGNYYVIVTSVTGCSDTAMATIGSTIGGAPVVSITPSADTLCAGESVTLSASGADTYMWSPSTGLSTTAGASVTATPTATTTYTLVGTNTSGCSDTAYATVVVNTLPATTISPVPNMCENAAAIMLTATPGGGTWSGTGVSASGLFTPSTLTPGNYTIIYTNSASGFCSNTDTVVIHIDALPVPIINTTGPFCSSLATTLLSANMGGGTWSGSGITNSATGAFSPASVGAGTTTVTYTVTTGTCTADTSITISIITSAPISISNTGPLSFCEGDSTVLTASYSGTETIHWSNGQTGNTVVVTSSGTYYAFVTSVCGTDTSNMLTVNVNTVNPAFDLTPTEGQVPLTVNIVNTTANTLTYQWLVADTVYASNIDTNVIYNEPGTYVVTLLVTNTFGCTDSISLSVLVYGAYGIVVPNVFTPNGDGQNDTYTIIVAGVKTVEAIIFNRWGQRLHAYSNNDIFDGKITLWDGKADGKYVADGSYAYVIKTISVTGEENVYNGFVTMFTQK